MDFSNLTIEQKREARKRYRNASARTPIEFSGSTKWQRAYYKNWYTDSPWRDFRDAAWICRLYTNNDPALSLYLNGIERKVVAMHCLGRSELKIRLMAMSDLNQMMAEDHNTFPPLVHNIVLHCFNMSTALKGKFEHNEVLDLVRFLVANGYGSTNDFCALFQFSPYLFKRWFHGHKLLPPSVIRKFSVYLRTYLKELYLKVQSSEDPDSDP